MKNIDNTNIVFLDYARNCLRYVIKAFNIKNINLPFYTCPTVWQAAKLEKCSVSFYHIDENFMPTCEFKKEDFIVYTNYFGICAKNVKTLAKSYKNLIIDNAHAFYMPDFGIASFNSIRKFFDEVSDGAVLNCSAKTDNLFKMSDLTKAKIGKIDVKLAKTKRLENFEFLNQNLAKFNQMQINLDIDDVPMVYPFLNSKTPKIKTELIKNNINIETYWGKFPQNTVEGKLQKYLLPLPIAQNLNNKDLESIISVLNKTL
jgi:hypothetical protein